MGMDAAILEEPRTELDPELSGDVSDVIPAITLWQPWATLWAAGVKTIETRGWSTPVRGRVLIHAAVRWEEDQAVACLDAEYQRAFEELGFTVRLPHGVEWRKRLFRGTIVGSADIVRVARTESLRDRLSPRELAFGDYTDRRFGWVSENQLIFDTPIKASGARKFWVPDAATLDACRAAIARAEAAREARQSTTQGGM